jgi:hypothetical protein
MKRVLIFALLLLTSISVNAADKLLHGGVAKDQDSKPTTSFSADVPKIYAFWVGDALKAGDKLRSVWIADDVGDAAPKGTKIDEATVTAEKDNDHGAFSLSKPNNGWPVGKYHVDIYVGDKLAETYKFTIGKSDAADGDDTDEDDAD